MLNSAFSTEAEAQLHSSHFHMVILHRRQTERLVLPGILLVADTNEGALSNCTTVANTFSRLSPGNFKSAWSRRRILGRAAAKTRTRSYLFSSRIDRQRS